MATLKSVLALEDKMTPVLSKAEQQAIRNIQTYNKLAKEIDNLQGEMGELYSAGLGNSSLFQQLSNASNSLTAKMKDMENGEANFVEETGKATSALGGFLAKAASFATLIAGGKYLMGLSDTYTQTHARLGLITEDVDTLEKQIYNSAQSSRVAYQSVAETVSKLGMQAGEAFNNSTDEVLKFSELLSKTFKTQGMDTNAIASTMYNMTQSLSSGRLLGQDYRILKQNAPQMIKYVRDYYKVSQAELDDLVSKGKVTAKGLKNAIFSAGEDIENKFKKMPVTFADAWTKFINSIQKILQPVAKVLSVVADGVDRVVTFLSQNEHILYGVAAAVGVVVAALIGYNIVTTIATVITAIFTGGVSLLAAVVVIVAIAIGVLVGVLIYLWNTNDEAAYYMIAAWDYLQAGIKIAGAVIKAVWNGLLVGLLTLQLGVQTCALIFVTAFNGVATILQGIVSIIAHHIQNLANSFVDAVNSAKDAARSLGMDWLAGDNLGRADFADKLDQQIKENMGERNQWMRDIKNEMDKTYGQMKDISTETWNTVPNEINDALQEFESLKGTWGDRTKNRTKITNEDIVKFFGGDIVDDINGMVGSDGAGGKALKVTTNDKLLSDEDIQLLLDVATRDYKINYQQVTPNITLTFGDVRETADVDAILDEVADRLEEIYDADLEVVPT